MKVALVTDQDYAFLTESDQLLIPAFNKVGIEAKPAVWDDATIDWAEFNYIVLRSCWNYHQHVEGFKSWLLRVEGQGLKMLNPLHLIQWNLHKKYLFDLRDRGVQVPDTILVPKGDHRTLAEILTNLKTNIAIIKPCFGASAHGVTMVKPESTTESEAQYRRLIAKSDVLAQSFVPEIRNGEYSAVFIGGGLSHVILKTPKTGDFRSNVEFGGTEELVTLSEELRAKVTEVFHTCKVHPLFARLDFVVVASEPVLMELELVEPYLFFEFKEHSAELFVSKFLEYIEAKTH